MATQNRAEKQGRNHQLDLLRICFATLVLLAHAPELTDGNNSRELFARMTGSSFSFGGVGLDGFFLLSGFLIVQSWQRDPDLVNFLSKRILRIVPGYLVAVFLSVAVVGVLAPGVPHFFHHFDRQFPISLLTLAAPRTPPVFPHQFLAEANGSLWTIHFEFLCYLMVAAFGVTRLLRWPIVWLATTALLLAPFVSPSLMAQLRWRHLVLATGYPDDVVRFGFIFFVGGCFCLFRQVLPFRPWLAVLCAFALAGLLFEHMFLEAGITVFGGYLLFYLGRLQLDSLNWMKHLPDVSYGIYLYGWPVEMLLIWFFHPSPWIVFAVSLVICFGLGWLSWHFVERPMLKLKRHTAPLPAP